MEVHAHAHTPRKKWTHYFWEFLMLFLAVFCGFLAEYQLEHEIENDRERQYMKSMVEDLHYDTAALTESYSFAKAQLEKEDSLIDMIWNNAVNRENISSIYLLHYKTSRSIGVDFEKRTATQLMNSGGMRLVHDDNVADSILSYWKEVKSLEFINSLVEDVGEKIADLGVKIFDSKYIIPGEKPLSPPQGTRPDIAFITNESALFAEYGNRQYMRRRRVHNYITRMALAKETATRLMSIIKNAYHLQ